MRSKVLFAAADVIPPDHIREAAREVLAQKHFQREGPPDVEHILEQIASLLTTILRPVMWLFRRLNEISPFLAWAIVIGFWLVVIAMVYYVLIAPAINRKRQSVRLGDGADESIARDPATYEKLIEAARSANEHNESARLCLLASLLRLEEMATRPFRAGATNRELLRRFRESAAFEPLKYQVELVEQTWYGGASCAADQAENSWTAYQRIRRMARETAHAK